MITRNRGFAISLPALVGLLLVACAAPAAKVEAEIHPRYADDRPIMVAVRTEGTGAAESALAEALRGVLLSKSYSPLSVGGLPDPETGFLRARLMSEAAPWTSDVLLEDAQGTVLFRAWVKEFRGDLPALASELLRALPEK